MSASAGRPPEWDDERVAGWLEQHGDEAHFIGEVEWALNAGDDREALHGAIRRLEARGWVMTQSRFLDDPHIAAETLWLVAWSRDLDASEVLGRLEARWMEWLKAFLGSHRCS